MKVRNITLMPLGGLAQMEEIPENPGQELRIALAGPLVNFAIAALLIGIGAVLSLQAIVSVPELFASLGSASWQGQLAYLTMANLALGLFNLIPAFPMDGGRILRALLAMKLDYGKATAIAARIGQGLALLMGLWGFVSGSYTLVLIAIFIWMGAEGEGKHVEVKSVLEEMKVGRAMTRSPQILRANDLLSRAVELTLSTSQSDFPVMEWGTSKMVGLLGEADVLRGLKAYGETAPVREVMRSTFPTARPDDPLFKAQQAMLAGRVRAVPVIDATGQLVGLLTADDINEAYRLLSVSPKLAALAG